MNRPIRLQGFTLVELLVVLGVIVILATVLLPSLFAGRIKANDAAAQTLSRQILNGLFAVEAGNPNFLNVRSCALSSSGSPKTVSYTFTDGSVDQVVMNAPPPVTSVTCSSSAAQAQVVVNYVGGTSGRSPLTLTAVK